MEPVSQHFRVNGTVLHVRRWGTGAPLILVHGGPGGSGAYWWPALEPIGQYRTVLAVDLRGHGKSARDPPYGIHTFAEDLEALVGRLGLARYAVLGHSYGATVALELAASDPRCTELVLVGAFHNPWTLIFRPRDLAAKLRLLGSLAAWDLGRLRKDSQARDGQAFARKILREARPVLQTDDEEGEQVEEVLAASVEHPIEAVYPLQWDLMRWRADGGGPQVRARSLVVVGDQDEIGLPEVDYFARSLGDVRIETVEGAGHSPFLDRRERFLEILADFFVGTEPTETGGDIEHHASGPSPTAGP